MKDDPNEPFHRMTRPGRLSGESSGSHARNGHATRNRQTAGNGHATGNGHAANGNAAGTSHAAGDDARSTFEEGLVGLLGEAALDGDRAAAEEVIAAFADLGISPLALIDVYIPATARLFGEAWCTDNRSFAEVTIAVARLQSWLRDLEPRPDVMNDLFCLDAPEILLVVPEGSQHTLGAMVAMSQFRRMGAVVRLSLGQDQDSVGALVRRYRFDLVAISAAGSEKLEFLQSLVNKVRMGVAPAPIVIIGGPILSEVPDIGPRIGADAATSDPEEALSLCGRTTSPSASSARHNMTTRLEKRGPPVASSVHAT